MYDRPDDIPAILHRRRNIETSIPFVIADVVNGARQIVPCIGAPGIRQLAGKLAERLGRTGMELRIRRAALVNEVPDFTIPLRLSASPAAAP